MGYQTLDVRLPPWDAQFAGFAVENSYTETLLDIPAIQDHLKALADSKDADHERELPGSIPSRCPSQPTDPE